MVFRSKKNFGFGRSLAWAGKQAIHVRYGSGRYRTRAAYESRWRNFAAFCKQVDVRDMAQVTESVVREYASYIASRHAPDTQVVLISAINVVMATVNPRWVRLSPKNITGIRRSPAREQVPGSVPDEVVGRVAQSLRKKGFGRAEAVFLLARTFGCRIREATLANLDRWQREAAQYGYVNITDGTKGGRRVERRIPVTEEGAAALALARAARPAGSRNLLASDEQYVHFLYRELRQARRILREHGVPGYHDARAAFSVECYELLTGYDAPVRGTNNRAPKEVHEAAARVVCSWLGHGRTSVGSSYYGPY